MKRIMILCLALGLGFNLNAQEIKVKKIRKINTEEEVLNYEFGAKSHLLFLETKGNAKTMRYNARFGRLKSLDATPETIQVSSDAEAPVASVRGKEIILSYGNGERKSMAPAGDVLYIWVSLSPDGDHILFKAVARGAYICDLEGNIEQELGQLNSPVWAGNDWVVGMVDEDDGHQFTSSDIYSFHRKSGKKQNLTAENEEIALYPGISPNHDRLVFKNEKGELFTSKIRIQ